MFNQQGQTVAVQVNGGAMKWYSVTVWYADEFVRILVVPAEDEESASNLVDEWIRRELPHENGRCHTEFPVELSPGVNLVFRDD